jgi:hypothetical protein
VLLLREKRCLHAIYMHYAKPSNTNNNSSSSNSSSSGSVFKLQLSALTQLCRDFNLAPGLVEIATAQAVYARTVHPLCSSLKELLAKERLADSNTTAGAATTTGTAASGACSVKLHGLSFADWLR